MVVAFNFNKMKIRLVYFLFILVPFFGISQEEEDFETEEKAPVTGFQYNGSEIGVDLAFSASTFGGNFGLGLKYGVKLGEYVIVGPSVRYERLWSKNALVGVGGSANVYGGGAFIHARFFNALFLGAEYEHLKSPFNPSGFVNGTESSSWAPTLFVGGGFSMSFNERIRLNAGIMYDLINAVNSPFRNSYSFKVTDENGNIQRYLPIIYRVAFFFPL